MARYLFEGTTPLILAGLHEGSTAWLEPADGRDVAPGVPVIHPGDRIRTLHPYPHGLLIRIPEKDAYENGGEMPTAVTEVANLTGTPEQVTPEPPAAKRARAPKPAPNTTEE